MQEKPELEMCFLFKFFIMFCGVLFVFFCFNIFSCLFFFLYRDPSFKELEQESTESSG